MIFIVVSFSCIGSSQASDKLRSDIWTIYSGSPGISSYDCKNTFIRSYRNIDNYFWFYGFNDSCKDRKNNEEWKQILTIAGYRAEFDMFCFDGMLRAHMPNKDENDNLDLAFRNFSKVIFNGCSFTSNGYKQKSPQ